MKGREGGGINMEVECWIRYGLQNLCNSGTIKKNRNEMRIITVKETYFFEI